MRVSHRGIALIKEFEGFRENAYADPVGIPTIGYGFVQGVKMGDRMTRAEAEARLYLELREYEHAVETACTVPPNQNEFDALVCFAWNVGIAGLRKSSVIRAHNRGDSAAAARAFGLWNKAGGKVFAGLVRRRAAEAALYLTPVDSHETASPSVQTEPSPMPQAVDEERPMTASTINRSAAVAGGSAAVATVAEVANTTASLKFSLQSLGDWLVPALLVVTVLAVGYIVWERVQLRKRGAA